MTSEQFKRPLTNAEFQRLMKDTFASPTKTTECFNDFEKILGEKIDKELRSLINVLALASLGDHVQKQPVVARFSVQIISKSFIIRM